MIEGKFISQDCLIMTFGHDLIFSIIVMKEYFEMAKEAIIESHVVRPLMLNNLNFKLENDYSFDTAAHNPKFAHFQNSSQEKSNI
jgi:hypothetical protein